MSDLISRSSLYKDIERRPYINKALAEIFETIIDQQPTVDAIPVVHGEWIIGSKPRCSVCGKSALREYDREAWLSYIPSDFCPHCGASMKKGE